MRIYNIVNLYLFVNSNKSYGDKRVLSGKYNDLALITADKSE